MRRTLATLLCLLAIAASALAGETKISGTTSVQGETSLGIAGGSGGGGTPSAFPVIPTAAVMRTIFHPGTWDRRADVSYGPSPQEPKLTTDCNVSGCGNIPTGGAGFPVNGVVPSAVVRSGPSTVQVIAYDPASHPTYGDGETCAEGITAEINGEKCSGVAALITEGSNQAGGSCGTGDGGAYIFTACNAKNTGTNRLSRVNLCTGVITPLSATSLNTCAAYGSTTPLTTTCLDAYGGSIPPANADHNRGQPDWHEYAMWTQTCLRVEQSGTNITLTGRTWRIGKAAGWVKGDLENNDPGPPAGVTTYTRYPIGTTIFSGTRASTINATGLIGVVGQAGTQSLQEAGMTNLRWSTTPQP